MDLYFTAYNLHWTNAGVDHNSEMILFGWLLQLSLGRLALTTSFNGKEIGLLDLHRNCPSTQIDLWQCVNRTLHGEFEQHLFLVRFVSIVPLCHHNSSHIISRLFSVDCSDHTWNAMVWPRLLLACQCYWVRECLCNCDVCAWSANWMPSKWRAKTIRMSWTAREWWQLLRQC